MNLLIEQAERVPLAADAQGVIRVLGSRVTLDTVAAAFDRGATPEEIVQQYPTLGLADVYSVLGYLLRHQAEVAAYLSQRAAEASAVRQQNEPAGHLERTPGRGEIGAPAWHPLTPLLPLVSGVPPQAALAMERAGSGSWSIE